MKTPLEISFKGLEKSRAVEAKVAERAERLERHFDRMTNVRVVVSAPNKLAHKGKHYEVKIEIGIPGGAPLIISEVPEGNDARSDLMIAIRNAFDAAERRLDDIAERLGGSAKKAERERRRPAKAAIEVD
jgi:putative sigma-54 modulation protein